MDCVPHAGWQKNGLCSTSRVAENGLCSTRRVADAGLCGPVAGRQPIICHPTCGPQSIVLPSGWVAENGLGLRPGGEQLYIMRQCIHAFLYLCTYGYMHVYQPQSATGTPLPWIRAIKGYSHSFRITC